MAWYDGPFMVGEINASEVRRALAATGHHDLVEGIDRVIESFENDPNVDHETLDELFGWQLRIGDVLARGRQSRFAKKGSRQ